MANYCLMTPMYPIEITYHDACASKFLRSVFEMTENLHFAQVVLNTTQILVNVTTRRFREAPQVDL